MILDGKDLMNKQILVLPNDKKVVSVEYEDGSAEYFLDLNERDLATLYSLAADRDETLEQTINYVIEQGIQYIEGESRSQKSSSSQCNKGCCDNSFCCNDEVNGQTRSVFDPDDLAWKWTYTDDDFVLTADDFDFDKEEE